MNKEQQEKEKEVATQVNNEQITESTVSNEVVGEKKEDTWQSKYDELNDKYLRLYSEYENFRRRTAKERIELITTAGEDIIRTLLPVMDDFDRAVESNKKIEDSIAIKEGIHILHQKFKKILLQTGLKEMEVSGEFNADLHEAIANIPAPSKKQKHKIVDIVEKGYLLGEKVIRYAKVVVGT